VLDELSQQDMRFDQIAGQHINSIDANLPIWTPRDYWIKILELRIGQVTGEYKNMIHKFNAGFDKYVRELRLTFTRQQELILSSTG
jgi:hypothetical protein